MKNHRSEQDYANSLLLPTQRKKSSRSFLRAAFLLLFGSLGATQTFAQSRRIELSDLAKIVSVSDPQISPDGKTIVVVVGRQSLEQDRTDRELVQVDISSRAQHALTYERKTAGSPRWSPSGDRL